MINKFYFVFSFMLFSNILFAGVGTLQEFKIISYNDKTVKVAQGDAIGVIKLSDLSKEDVKDLHKFVNKNKALHVSKGVKWIK